MRKNLYVPVLDVIAFISILLSVKAFNVVGLVVALNQFRHSAYAGSSLEGSYYDRQAQRYYDIWFLNKKS